MAAELGYEAYHHHTSNKAQILGDFYSQKQLIIATSAFGIGIDIANIRVVLHTDRPRRLLDYAQESGRAGRDGDSSEAIIVTGDIIREE